MIPLPRSGQVIICYSHYGPIRTTRQRMLERAGYTVQAVESQADFHDAVLKGAVDLVLLCQTLTDEESREAVRLISTHCPAARCFALCSDLAKGRSNSDVDVLDIGQGPDHWVQAITHLLPLEIKRSHTAVAPQG